MYDGNLLQYKWRCATSWINLVSIETPISLFFSDNHIYYIKAGCNVTFEVTFIRLHFQFNHRHISKSSTIPKNIRSVHMNIIIK